MSDLIMKLRYFENEKVFKKKCLIIIFVFTYFFNSILSAANVTSNCKVHNNAIDNLFNQPPSANLDLFNKRQHQKKIPPKIESVDISADIYLEKKDNLDCPSKTIPLLQSHPGVSEFKASIENMSLSINCLSSLTTNLAKAVPGAIQGIGFGNSVGVAFVAAGGSISTEILVLKLDAKRVMIGLVKNKTASLGLGLPVSGGISEVIPYGDCTKGVSSYVGYFQGVSVAGVAQHNGIDNPIERIPTGCNAATATLGPSNISIEHFLSLTEELGPSYIVRGPRVETFLRELANLEQDRKDAINFKGSVD